jgi:DNA-3-methyladenine glycosylase
MNQLQRPPIPLTFFHNPDVVTLARELIGKSLVTEMEGIRSSGIIVETEAYRGADDRACHAYNYRRTTRTETMFKAGGHAYVYLCYGIHPLFNIVTNLEGEPDAVLIRAVQPTDGIEWMRERRPRVKDLKLGSGPGCVTKALGIDRTQNAKQLIPSEGIWLEENTLAPIEFSVEARTRIGVDYAGEDAKRLWRFVMTGNPCVSKP